jgi:hypothetical protein
MQTALNHLRLGDLDNLQAFAWLRFTAPTYLLTVKLAHHLFRIMGRIIKVQCLIILGAITFRHTKYNSWNYGI